MGTKYRARQMDSREEREGEGKKDGKGEESVGK